MRLLEIKEKIAAEDNAVTCTILYVVETSMRDAKKWQLVSYITKRWPGFDSRSDHVRILADRVTLEQGFLWLLWFSTFSIITPTLRTFFRLHIALTRTKKLKLKIFQEK